MNDEITVSTEQNPLELFQLALSNMAAIQERYSELALILAEVILIAEQNRDDDAEIGLRVKRLVEDYGAGYTPTCRMCGSKATVSFTCLCRTCGETKYGEKE